MDERKTPVVLSEPALRQLPTTLEEDTLLVHFKLVGIGPQAYQAIKGKEKVARKMMGQQPNFYVSSSKEDMREALHAYVDRFCNAQGV